jgi:outer membrane protein assembly factor BamB
MIPGTNAFSWGKEGPPSVWKQKVGKGFSGPVVGGGKVILFHREGNRETLTAWESPTGKTVWTHALPATYEDDFGFDDGPRAVPAIADGRVFAWGADGAALAVSLVDGSLVWKRDLAREVSASKGFFGFACSPLVVGDLVIFQPGGADGATLVALKAADGSIAWKAGSDEAGYASPVLSKRAGPLRVVAFTREGLLSVEALGGTAERRFPWRASMHASVNAATPLLVGDSVFLTASYGTGAVCLGLEGERPRERWSGDDALSSHFATPVEHDGFLYGFHGRQESGADFRCIEVLTGRVKWSLPRVGMGAILRRGGQLLVVLETGELRLMAADPAAPRERARAQVAGAQVRALPAFAEGVLFLRDTRQLVALRLSSE